MTPGSLDVLTPSLQALIPDSREAEIGPGRPDAAVEAPLADLDLVAAFAPHRIVDLEMARACHSGLWLVHNFLDRSHELSQTIKNPTGSFWHGIMHRREGDFSNAKYWFRQVGDHPIFEPLAAAVAELETQSVPSAFASLAGNSPRWDPAAFVDLCAAIKRSDAAQLPFARRIARIEWELLIRYSYLAAIES
ncbi:MAG: hypothetical protein DWQ31_21665 [Planctomycetota bacterium]|nr:MAG: hypothetical protein DWQ31_21665 [Planctomycetota bacterium]REJ93709.1 MAG: hypothetical protein DWQ35_10200 [Planctomycetota bacterium]